MPFISSVRCSFGPQRLNLGRQPLSTITGGSITTSGGYRTHTYTTPGSYFFNTSSYGSTINIEYMVLAGGGAGGPGMSGYWEVGGGGGAGGYIYNSSYVMPVENATVSVGSGGVGVVGTDANVTAASKGQNSSFRTFIASGGGGGAANYVGTTRDGGSGGGGAGNFGNIAAGGNPVSGQGNGGGAGVLAGSSSGAGAGGGFGGVGGSGSGSTGGTGGTGVSNSISGTSLIYAAGGGGSGSLGGGGNGSGGSGIGGAGGGGNAVAGRGSGGGGTRAGGTAGSGSNGVVIIRYLNS